MPRVSVVLLFLAFLCWIDTTAVAMSLLPDFLIRKAQNVTEKDAEQDAEKVAAEAAGKEQEKTAEKQAYDQLFADKVVVKKSERKLYLVKQGKPFRTYSISLGFKPQGHKQRQGDGRTPEGSYMLDWRKSNSKFRKALHVSYPSYVDQRRAEREGVDPGGMIMVHGYPSGGRDHELREAISKEDWTEGCIAVSNPAIDEIWRHTRDGTPIEILP